jgi:ATP-dependent Lon protease
MPPEAHKQASRELKRLRKMHTSLAEYQVVRTYLEWLAELPWTLPSSFGNGDDTETSAAAASMVVDLAGARKQLDMDHYGLETVKKRVLEYLAVRKLKKDLRGPILCFLGPPGVGKTSMGRSIAGIILFVLSETPWNVFKKSICT